MYNQITCQWVHHWLPDFALWLPSCSLSNTAPTSATDRRCVCRYSKQVASLHHMIMTSGEKPTLSPECKHFQTNKMEQPEAPLFNYLNARARSETRDRRTGPPAANQKPRESPSLPDKRWQQLPAGSHSFRMRHCRLSQFEQTLLCSEVRQLLHRPLIKWHINNMAESEAILHIMLLRFFSALLWSVNRFCYNPLMCRFSCETGLNNILF